MDLDEFVKESLTRIIKGIEGANREVAEFEKRHSDTVTRSRLFDIQMGVDKGKGVEFDVAVTSKRTTGGKGSVKAKLFVVEAQVDGAGSREREDISRIKFTVVVR